ncbi:hypothetical protein ACJX0J_033150, partial [Zea mays]
LINNGNVAVSVAFVIWMKPINIYLLTVIAQMSKRDCYLVTVIIGHNTHANVPIIFNITNQITKIAYIFLVKVAGELFRGEVHPHNILLDNNFGPKVANFGCEWDQEEAMYHWALGDSSYSAISKLDIIEDMIGVLYSREKNLIINLTNYDRSL